MLPEDLSVDVEPPVACPPLEAWPLEPLDEAFWELPLWPPVLPVLWLLPVP